MQLKIWPKLYVFMIIIFIISYATYIIVNKNNVALFEENNPIVWKLNSTIRDAYWKITWKSEELSNSSKDLYEKNVAPKINEAKTEVEDWVNLTKQKIDNVRKSLSWAEETINKTKEVINKWTETINQANDVLNDLNKMWDSIKNSINTWAVN